MVVGEGLFGAKAPHPSGRCLRQRALALLESNLNRRFSTFPDRQNMRVLNWIKAGKVFLKMVVGEGLLGAKAPHPSGRCLRQRALALLESNLNRRFSTFPDRQNMRVLNWIKAGKVFLKMVVGEGFEPSKSMTADLQSAPFGRSGTPPGVILIVDACAVDGGGGRIRTFEVDDGRFTVCSLWPLGNPTTG